MKAAHKLAEPTSVGITPRESAPADVPAPEVTDTQPVSEAQVLAMPDAVTDEQLRFERIVIRTRWLTEQDDLATVVADAVSAHLRPGDTVIVSEKIAILLSGRTVPMSRYPPGRLARLLARSVRPRPGSRGLSVPEKMQYVVEHTRRARMIAAALASALTRSIGIRGVFYRVAGSLARDIDGGRPPFEHLLFPPLHRSEALRLTGELEAALGKGVAIVDMNDFGGSIRATSPRALPAELLASVLADNPLGQREERTPIGIVRAASDAASSTSGPAPGGPSTPPAP